MGAAFSTYPGSPGGGRWAAGMVPRPGMGCLGWVWPLVSLPWCTPTCELYTPRLCWPGVTAGPECQDSCLVLWGMFR